MNLDILLIKKIEVELKELGQLIQEKLYDKEAILNKIKLVINDLDQLNTIKVEVFKEYKNKQEQFYGNIQQSLNSSNDIMKNIEEYNKWMDRLIKYIPEPPPADFLKEGERFEAIIRKPELAYIGIDNTLMAEVLNIDMHIHFTKKRKKSLWWSDIIFRFRISITGLVKVVVGAGIGILAEEIFGIFMPRLHKFTITLVITIILYFALDKFLNMKFDKLFWKSLQIQILKISNQFNLYLEQMNILIKSMEKDLRKNQ